MSNQRENHREDVAGRANVEDTPELLAYYEQLEKFSTGALWTVANKIEPWQPKSQSVLLERRFPYEKNCQSTEAARSTCCYQ